MSDQRHIIRGLGVEFEYRKGVPVLRGVDFTATAGKLICILGPNGSGKTTLLKCLLGQLKPTAGDIILDDKPLRHYSPKALARLMAYVPQLPRSTFAFTVMEIVLMGRYARGGPGGITGPEDMTVATLAMKMTETTDFADRTLEELSGGEAQCVMIARALAQQPAVMMLDEPTSHLDVKNQLMIYRMMQRLAHDWRMAVICVSHDVNLAGRFADELVMMRSGQVTAAGAAPEVMTQDILSRTYGVQIELITVADSAVPLVRAN